MSSNKYTCICLYMNTIYKILCTLVCVILTGINPGYNLPMLPQQAKVSVPVSLYNSANVHRSHSFTKGYTGEDQLLQEYQGELRTNTSLDSCCFEYD